jgi:cytochrome P450
MTGDPEGASGPRFPSLYENFDIHAPVVNEHFNEVNRDLVEHCPVAHSANRGEDGYWIVNRAQDVLRVGQSKTFSAEDGISLDRTELAAPEEVEDPLHTPLRALMNPYLTRAAVARHRPAIENVANRLIDGFIDDGEVDAISQYANLLAAEAFALIVGGIPQQDMPMLHRDTHGQLHAATAEERAAAWYRVVDYCDSYMRRRRDHGGSDELVDALIDWEFEGFEWKDKVNCLVQLLEGGLGTTSSVIGEGLRFLATNPPSRQRLLDDPSLLSQATEEWLRTTGSVFTVARKVKEDTEIAGTTLKTGDWVYINFAAANFDSRKFEDPMTTNIDRHPNPHVAFGAGRHRCIGSHLARMDLLVAFETFLTRIPHFSLAEGFTPTYSTMELRTMDSLRLQFPLPSGDGRASGHTAMKA